MQHLTLKIELEVCRLVDLERISVEATKLGNQDRLNLIAYELTNFSENIKKLICDNANVNVGDIFTEYSDTVLQLDEFREFAHQVKREALYLSELKYKEQNDTLSKMPNNIIRIMSSLTTVSNESQDSMGEKFNLRHFVSQFLIYTLSESESLLPVQEMNKKNLYDQVYGKDSEERGIRKKIEKIYKDYPSLYPSSSMKEISYETAKKRMQEMLPSKHKKNRLDQSHYLNIHEAHALLIHFLIYPSKYRRFLSNPNGKNVKVPDYEVFEMVRESIEDLFMLEPLSNIPSELFAKSVIEDTIHTRLFNAVTFFIMEIIREFLELMKLMSKQDTLGTLFALDQMISDVPEITKTWTNKYLEVIKEIHLLSDDEDVQKNVRNAIKDKESLSYARDNLLNLFEKYDTIYKGEFAVEENEKEKEAAGEIFKHVVKLFYQTDEGEIAYKK